MEENSVVVRKRVKKRIFKKPSAKLMKECRKYHVKTFWKKGNKKFYKPTKMLKEKIRKIKKYKPRYKKPSAKILKMCRSYRIAVFVGKGKRRKYLSTSTLKERIRRKKKLKQMDKEHPHIKFS
jgi:hypothetical protein